MRFVFDQQLMAGNYSGTTVSYFVDLIEKMASISPADEFILLTQPGKKPKRDLSQNVFVSTSSTFATRLFGSRFLEQARIASDLKKLQPDVFVGFDNPELYRYPVQKMLFQIGSDSHDPKFARSVAAASAGVFGFGQNLPIPFFPSEQRVSWGLKENIKVQYSGGYDYFLFAGDISNRYRLIDMLKGFSFFKQWQQSGMRLLIAGRETSETAAFEELLDSYKYRGDVILYKNPSDFDISDLMSAAYAFLHPAGDDSFPINLLKAVSHGLAIITTDIPVVRKWLGDAPIYLSGDIVNSFSKYMQLVYKDEAERDQVAEAQDRLVPPELDDLLYARMLLSLLHGEKAGK